MASYDVAGVIISLSLLSGVTQGPAVIAVFRSGLVRVYRAPGLPDPALRPMVGRCSLNHWRVRTRLEPRFLIQIQTVLLVLPIDPC
jgi:hypothetical protein